MEDNVTGWAVGIILHSEPELNQPHMIVGWPGIGNIGVITVDNLRQQIEAEELGEIEPWDYFYPSKVVIRASVLHSLEFPTSKFYYKRLANRDLLLFVGEEQPSGRGRMYAEGGKAYEMANQVLDVAEKFGCSRIYTSGAAVALTHHSWKPRVWAVATDSGLLAEMKGYANTLLMSEVEGRGDVGNITGLNGLLIGVAKKRGLEGVCLMGEIPDYLSRVPFPYPKASQSVLEMLAAILGVSIDMAALDDMTAQMEDVITNVFRQFPNEVRDRIDQRRQEAQPGMITEEDEKWLKENIDDFFRQEEGDKGQ
ncbi:MAG: PAC2 family protein [Dehalococcoidales bacterium]|nr:MAG: PAC2 family protein [Dehalococcoidales bacterium]